MKPFAYLRAASESAALAAADAAACYVAGGTDFMQLWKAGVSSPQLVIDINRLPYRSVALDQEGACIGALATMSSVAEHPGVGVEFPVIVQALLASASPQVRNVATIGGNLLQRTRCPYFRAADLPCNKRNPGSGCGALDGLHRQHAIFGGSDSCVATHASDLAVALLALDARVRVHGGAEREISLDEMYLLPGDHPERETTLEPGELLAEIRVPRSPRARRSLYLKVRDRASFEFAVVSVAVALELRGARIESARIAAGGVGTKPWRLRACEQQLEGAECRRDVLVEAARTAAQGARPLEQNGFKVPLLERAVLRALLDASGAV